MAAPLAAAAATWVPSPAAVAFDPAPWTHLLLPAPVGYSPTTSTTCRDGSITCVDDTIAHLQSQLDPLVATCDHKLMFNFAYLRITQAYRRIADDPGYFHDAPY